MTEDAYAVSLLPEDGGGNEADGIDAKNVGPLLVNELVVLVTPCTCGFVTAGGYAAAATGRTEDATDVSPWPERAVEFMLYSCCTCGLFASAGSPEYVVALVGTKESTVTSKGQRVAEARMLMSVERLAIGVALDVAIYAAESMLLCFEEVDGELASE